MYVHNQNMSLTTIVFRIFAKILFFISIFVLQPDFLFVRLDRLINIEVGSMEQMNFSFSSMPSNLSQDFPSSFDRNKVSVSSVDLRLKYDIFGWQSLVNLTCQLSKPDVNGDRLPRRSVFNSVSC